MTQHVELEVSDATYELLIELANRHEIDVAEQTAELIRCKLQTEVYDR